MSGGEKKKKEGYYCNQTQYKKGLLQKQTLEKPRESNYFFTSANRIETATVEALKFTPSIKFNSGFQSMERFTGTSVN